METAAVEFKNVTHTFPGGTEVLKDVSFSIKYGEKVGLLGKNGAGKSTLMLHTNGLLIPDSGSILIEGIEINKKTLSQIRQKVGLVFQNADDQLFMPTVEEDVAFGPLNMGLPPAEVEARVRGALERVGCGKLSDIPPQQLSGGSKRRVAIATVLSMNPTVMVLDEPSSNLDWESRANLRDLIKSFDHTCIIATHDIGLALDICDRIMVLDKGKLIADLDASAFCRDEEVLSALGIKSINNFTMNTGGFNVMP